MIFMPFMVETRRQRSPMRLHELLLLAVVLAAGACANSATSPSPAPSGEWREATIQERPYRFTDADAQVAVTVGTYVNEGEVNAISFLSLQYTSPFTVTIHPDRASLDAQWRVATACWMIAGGWRADVSLLSPRVWNSQSCGHDGGNASHVRYVLRHELVHVLHAQHAEIALATPWFVEGLAVYASGQIDTDYAGGDRSRLAAGFRPQTIAELWADGANYPLAGSLVRYIDRTYGRAMLRDMMAHTTTAGMLSRIGIEEAALLDAWREDVLR
jgi:hypothetical protein